MQINKMFTQENYHRGDEETENDRHELAEQE